MKSNDKGFALVITMLFALIGLALSGALLFMVIEATKMSGIAQRYSTALDAGKGAADVVMNLMMKYTPITLTTPDFGTVQSSPVGSAPNANCLNDKITNPTFDTDGVTWKWTNCSATCASPCAYTSTDATVNPDIITNYTDVYGNPTFTVYTKIIDTEIVPSTGCPAGAASGLVYTVSITSQKTNNPGENAQINFLYRVCS